MLPAAAALLLCFLVACGSGNEGSSTGSSASLATATEAAARPSGSSTPAATVSTAPTAAAAIPDVKLQRVFPNISVRSMTGLYQTSDGRWFALEQVGHLLEFPDSADARATQVLDLTDRVTSEASEEGLLGFAAAPDFATSGVFYLLYTADNPLRDVLSRFRLQSSSDATKSTEQLLLEVPEPFSNHNGGQIAFGPDGYLYLGLGDGGSERDPQHNGQN
ncbi:MAG TPA: PQQ-dependent sugar dehydrogenase, partial [Dehalococcoidia bacterium]|nr:PQQ-dependent sugar dehydrogenase [Dehalococcoidia bacterium]